MKIERTSEPDVKLTQHMKEIVAENIVDGMVNRARKDSTIQIVCTLVGWVIISLVIGMILRTVSGI